MQPQYPVTVCSMPVQSYIHTWGLKYGRSPVVKRLRDPETKRKKGKIVAKGAGVRLVRNSDALIYIGTYGNLGIRARNTANFL